MSSYQLFKDLHPAIESALRSSIERFGVLVPVAFDQHGNVLDGHQRQRIAETLGVDYPRNVVIVSDEDEAREIARTLNEDRRAMPKAERLEVVKALREDGHSIRAIAGAVGIDSRQVQRELSGVDMSTPPATRGLDGKTYPARREPRQATEAGEATVDATHEEDEIPVEPATEPAPKEESEQKWQGDKGVLITTGEDDWLTPPHIVEAAAASLGAIDLDPCSSLSYMDNVPAALRWTVEDNGLSRQWSGRVYMNPPYGRPIGDWTSKLASSYASGDVTAYVALVPGRTDTKWFADFIGCHYCFIRGRLSFGNVDQGAPFPSVAIYAGPHPDWFHAEFAQHGLILTEWKP